MPRALLAIVVCVASFAVQAGTVLELAGDFAFKREAVDRFAERAYRQQLDSYAREGGLDCNPALLARLAPLMERIVTAAVREAPAFASLQWEFHTCAACAESASARAGGKLLVAEEFVRAHALTDDEIGYVLAHEAAHVIAQHTRELASAARYFMDNGLHREYWDIQRELDASLIVQTRTAFISARQEEDADRIGLILGAQAGFAPAAMITLLDKLAAAGGPRGIAGNAGFERRRAVVNETLPSAQSLYARAAAPWPDKAP